MSCLEGEAQWAPLHYMAMQVLLGKANSAWEPCLVQGVRGIVQQGAQRRQLGLQGGCEGGGGRRSAMQGLVCGWQAAPGRMAGRSQLKLYTRPAV